MSSLLRSAATHRLTRILRAVVPLLLLAALVAHVGADPFTRSLQVLSAGPIAAALLLGVITTTAQALRWRTVATGYGAAEGLTRYRAVAECYRSALLNAVLPGGVLGDAVRVWRQRAPRERGLRSSAQAVIGERVAGTVLLMLAVAVVTLPMKPMVSGMALIGAGVAAVVAAPSLKRLLVREQLAVWGWSALALASLVIKFGVAALALGTVSDLGDIVTLALLVLAGMSIPFGVGGFGPREAVAAVAFAAVGLSADSGVATAAAYGVLAAVSALPGVMVMLLDLRRSSTEVVAEAVVVSAAPAVPVSAPVPAEPVSVRPHRAPVRVGSLSVARLNVGRLSVGPKVLRTVHGVHPAGLVQIDLDSTTRIERQPAWQSA
jgi:uncharacterized membrane protein YbhN (UPF0104 family)